MAYGRPFYETVYKNGTAAGLCVTQARQHYQNGDGTQPRLEQEISTPWTIRGNPVIGVTSTDLRNAGRSEDGLRKTDKIELYATDGLHRSDIQQELAPGCVLLDQKKQAFPLYRAIELVGQFASAASEYPHVFTFDEYMESRSYLNGRFNMAPPTAEDYNAYLRNVTNQLASPDYTFTGAITKRSQISSAYSTMPDFQEEYDDWSSSLDY